MSVEIFYECEGEKIKLNVLDKLEKVQICKKSDEKMMFLSTETLKFLKCQKCNKTIFECQAERAGIKDINKYTNKQLFEYCEISKENDIYIKGYKLTVHYFFLYFRYK